MMILTLPKFTSYGLQQVLVGHWWKLWNILKTSSIQSLVNFSYFRQEMIFIFCRCFYNNIILAFCEWYLITRTAWSFAVKSFLLRLWGILPFCLPGWTPPMRECLEVFSFVNKNKAEEARSIVNQHDQDLC